MRWLALSALLLCLPAAGAPTVAEIVDKNVAARGGAEAWRRVETMGWSGHVENSGAAAEAAPRFVLEMKRPNRTHFEVATPNGRFVRVFDGTRGWKMRPGGNTLPELQAFSLEEAAFARDEFPIEGALLDYESKRVAVVLEGMEPIEGRLAYRLGLRLASGARRRVWIDAQSWLDVKHDRPPSRAAVFYRDYRVVEGLQIPHRIETGVVLGKAASTLVIERVVINPALADRVFAKPAVPGKRHATVSVGGNGAPWRAP